VSAVRGHAPGDLDRLVAAAWPAVEAAVEGGRIPGAALGVATADGVALREAGWAQTEPERVPLPRDAVFDLASLTKVILTTTQVLRLVEEGIADLDDPLSRHLPDLYQYRADARVRRITVRQALAHRAGLPAVEPVYTWGGDPWTLKTALLQRDWPEGEHVYSDIGFMLLGLAVERRRGRPLAELAAGQGLTAAPDPDRCAATERCAWRRRVVRGTVHDENAHALGGLAGHAGLFGTAEGVLGFARDLMAGRILSGASLAEMRRPQLGGTRGLGWEIKVPGWTGGSLCSPDTVGHTGFTGTGLWIDFGRGIAWTLLTNRVHPTRHAETGIMDLRRSVGNAVAAAWTRAA
jgi:CubicO group peptidase (beta-lactamase class C family)